MSNESIVYAGMLGLRSVYTDHSLFGFNDVASVVLNRVSAIAIASAKTKTKTFCPIQMK
jgi:phosphatidylinositol glycan class A protein